jgi:putative phosphoribosyl transferase
MTYRDRGDAGRKLSRHLLKYGEEKGVVVLGLPRGGVVVAAEVAGALGAPLDVMIVRKLGSPRNPELAIGALAETGARVLNRDIIASLRVPQTYLEEETARQGREIVRRKTLYRGGGEILPLRGKTVIVVDDGIATGGTLKTALAAVSQAGAARVVFAVPVAPAEVLAEMREKAGADEGICLLTPNFFRAVSLYYRHFDQTGDDEVVQLLNATAQFGGQRE